MTESVKQESDKDRNTDVIREAWPMIPGILLCLVILLMLTVEIILPGMADSQYIVFPLLLKITGLAGILSAFRCFLSVTDMGRVKPDVTGLLFALFAVLMIVSTLVNGISRDAVLGVPYRYIGVFDLLVFFACYMYCSSAIKTESHRHFILISFMIISDLVAGAFIYDLFISEITAFRAKSELAAIFFHGNHYGYFLVMACIISAGYCIYGHSRQTAAGAVSLAVNLFALAANRSVGCVIATGFVLPVMVITAAISGKEIRKKSLLMLLIAAVMAAIALIGSRAMREDLMLLIRDMAGIISGSQNDYAGHGRWMLWKETADYIADRPFLGYGCEGIRYILDETAAGSPHNEPLTYAAFFGIPSAVAYCTGVILSVIKGLKSSVCRSGIASGIAAFAALGYFVSSLFGVAMFYTAPFLFVFMGMAVSRGDTQ